MVQNILFCLMHTAGFNFDNVLVKDDCVHEKYWSITGFLTMSLLGFCIKLA